MNFLLVQTEKTRRAFPPGLPVRTAFEPDWCQLLKYRYFHAPYVAEFTLSPDEPLTYNDRIRALMPDSPGAPRLTEYHVRSSSGSVFF